MKKFLATALLTAGIANAANVADLERKINVLTQEVQKMKTSKSSSRVHLGGYGEIIFTDRSSEDESGSNVTSSSSDKSAQWDTLRNVLYVGYDFSDKWSFMTEIEIEHANEIYTEFAEVRYAHSELVNFKAGLLLAPVGHINEMHEPTRFIGVTRPELESAIIPTTWRENGIGLHGKKNNFSYKFYIMNSLNSDNFKASGVRSGRQKGAKAYGGNHSYILRADYATNFGLDFGATAMFGKTNGLTTAGNKHNMIDLHAEFNKGGFQSRVLYVQADLDGKQIGQVNGNAVADKMVGYYVEAAYNVMHGKNCFVAPYVRYENYNTQDDVDSSVGTASKANEVTNLTYGVMYKPVEKVSFKLDYTKNETEAKTGVDTVNFGIGWEY